MDEALRVFEDLVDYEVAEVLAAATFYIAEIYGHFSEALLESERPAGLDGAELQDYELAIEEEAFPFEERAIEVHERNLELMVAGTYNGWVEQSLDRLSVLMPGRYAKHEISSGYIGSMETYAYRSPKADALEGERDDGVSAQVGSEVSDVSAGPEEPSDGDLPEASADQEMGVGDVSALL
jgi:hypothetical protein